MAMNNKGFMLFNSNVSEYLQPIMNKIKKYIKNSIKISEKCCNS